MPMPAAARRSSALAPMPGTVRSGGGCGEELLEAAEEDELRRDEAAAQATEGELKDEEEEDDEKKGAGVGVATVWREPIDENDDLRSAPLAREGQLLLLLLLLPCIAERAANVARGGLCGAEAAEAEATGGGAEAVDDETLIEKEAAIDGRSDDDDDDGKGESSREPLLLLLPRRELVLVFAESAAASETRRVSFLDRRERIRSASLVRRRESRGFFFERFQMEESEERFFLFSLSRARAP